MRADEWYFYRVENRDGYGPYYHRRVRSWMEGYHGENGDRVHPGLPDEIGLEKFTSCLHKCGVKQEDCRFGFVSLSQLQRWFSTGELSRLKKQGYRIVRRLGREILSTPTQSMFVNHEGVKGG
jgi:hypothetical protein